jgi:Reverse transcriptase (RNA-dependent DNA polymerase)
MAEAKAKTERNNDAGQKDKEEGEVKKKGYNFNKGHRVASKKFEGKCEELNGAIFDCSESKMADTFVKTKKELSAYCGRTFKYGGDIRLSIDTLETPTFYLPDDLPTTATAGQMKLWGDQVTLVGKQMAGYNENIKKLYALVWGQCTDLMQQKLESSDGWDAIWRSGDGLKLLILIKNIAYAFQSQNYPARAIHEAKKRYFNLMQSATTTLKEHLTVFNNLVDVLEHTGGNIDDDVGVERFVLNGRDKATMTNAELRTLKSEVRDRTYGTAFMLTCDRGRFGKYIEGVNNDYNEGNDRYPRSRADAFHRLSNYQNNPRLGQREVGGEGEIAFVNADGDKGDKKSKAKNKENVTCHRCKKKGHYANECDGERVVDGNDKDKDKDKAKKQSGTTLLTSGMFDVDFLDDQPELSNYAFVNAGAVGSENGVVMQIEHDGKLPRDWILLDNQSTVDVFCNKKLLSNIREHSKSMDIHCNAGVSTTNLIGELRGYGTVWYNPTGIANILSLAKAQERGYRVTFDTEKGNAFHLTKHDGNVRVFKQSPKGLYYLDTNEAHDEVEDTGHYDVNLVNTVEDNRIKYSDRDYSKAVLARKVQKIIGRPSTKTFLDIVDKNLLPNCPVKREDIVAAEKIFGPEVGSLMGKTVRKTPKPVQPTYTSIPATIMSRYQEVTLAGDIMFVNKLPFFVTISRNIRFCTSEFLANRKTDTIFKAITHVHQTYRKRGFKIVLLLMDGEFDKDGLVGDIANLGTTTNCVAADEHVPEIERQIRTIKDRSRSAICVLPFRQLPARMVIELIHYVVFWLNSFPAKKGISDTLSPRALVVGSTLDYASHCKLEFGAYVQTHEQHDNSMMPRTTGAIALRPTGNAQGGHYFYSLTTGKRLNRTQWTELPMPADVVDRVHKMSRRDLELTPLEFADRHGVLIPDDDDDSVSDDDDDDDDFDPNDAPADDDDSDSWVDGQIAGVDDEIVDNLAANADNDDDNNDDDNASTNNDDDNDDDNVEEIGEVEAEDVGTEQVDVGTEQVDTGNVEEDDGNVETEPEPGPLEGPANENQDVDIEDDAEPPELVVRTVRDDDDDDDAIGTTTEDPQDQPAAAPATTEMEPVLPAMEVDELMDVRYGRRLGKYNLRARKPRDYSHLHTTLESIVMTQHSVRKGLRIFGEAGVDAVLKELKQLYDREVVRPVGREDMTDEERDAALQYLMYLKQKRDGTVKGRGCADGRKQRAYTTKEEASSPTVATESVMLSCVIDAEEERDVGVVDLPGAFMQVGMEGERKVHIKLEGKMAELMVRIDPKMYRKYIQMENGKMVLYAELEKALYGTLIGALLFWRKLSKQLIKWGFTLNPYDNCVANKMINGKQCTVLWHVDDLKISHVDPKVVDEVIELLKSEFGKEAPLTISRGKVHEYLGMTIDFSEKGKVKFTMLDYVENVLKELPADMSGTVRTPAASHLFDVNEDAEKLSAELGDFFHHNVAKLLFLCKRARPDIQTAVAFLCTRVKAPDVDDYKKLGRVMMYLRGTSKMPLTLEANGCNVVKWWVDASFAVHPDMRSHTGGVMMLGKGAIYGTSTRQKINTKSSTEAELVGVNDILPQALWTRYFLEAQGYAVDESVVYQDNKSTILLAENGKASSGKRTRHINIRYFFIKDRVASGEVKIKHCPTTEMIGDFFTKPLQGAQFTKFRDEIMNVNSTTYIEESQNCRSVLNNVVDRMTGHSETESVHGTDTGWKTVESKQEIKEKRKQTRMSAGKTEDVSRVNGKTKCKRVSFASSSDSLILI